MAKAFVEGEILRYQAAQLRLIMALKRRRGDDPERVIDRVAAETGLEAPAFRAYLLAHSGGVAKLAVRGPEPQDREVSRAEALAQAKALGLELEEPVRMAARGARKMRSPVA